MPRKTLVRPAALVDGARSLGFAVGTMFYNAFGQSPWWAQQVRGDDERRAFVHPAPRRTDAPRSAVEPPSTPGSRPERLEHPAPSVESPLESVAGGQDGASDLPSLQAERRRLAATLADLEGVKRRVERDAERAKQAARASLLEELLPVLDNLDRSLASADGSSKGALLAGVQIVREDLEQTLLRYGAERIPTLGRPFDPYEHEAVGVRPVHAPDEDGRVMQEWRAGYRFGDRVLRAAQVLVGKRIGTATRS